MSSVDELIEEIATFVARRDKFLDESIDYVNFVKETLSEYQALAQEEGAGSQNEAKLLAEAQKLRERSRERARNGRKTMANMHREMHDLVAALYVALEYANEAAVRRAEPALADFEDVLAEWLPAVVSAAWEVL